MRTAFQLFTHREQRAQWTHTLVHHFCRLRNPRFQVPSKEPAAFKPTRRRFSASREFRVECTASERNHGTKAGGWREIEKETEARGVVRALLRTDATPWCRRYASLIILVRVNQSRRSLTTILVYARLNDRRWVKPCGMSPHGHWPWGERTSEKRDNISVCRCVVRITVLYDRY